MEPQTTQRKLTFEEDYVNPSQERRRELGTLVEKYQTELKETKDCSIEEVCKRMHPHCETISEALFVGAFTDFMLSGNREERIQKVKEKLAKMLAAELFGDLLKKAATSMAEEETKEAAEETK